ncbi:MAG: hypothetical protein BGO78_11925 [Chloroflexi bacterium 44-23]|nr:MAG: hypothetical protein BGO78_11925 [Chloroflexi bacterium 44-23]
MVSIVEIPHHSQAWQVILGQLRADMSRADFETWVRPLVPLGFGQDSDSTFRLAAYNEYTRDWVTSRLQSTISRKLQGLYHHDVKVEVIVTNDFSLQEDPSQNGNSPKVVTIQQEKPQSRASISGGNNSTKSIRKQGSDPTPSHRKMVLQRAYGTERANVIHPERGMFVTHYYLDNWVKLIGHSGSAVVLAARRLCFWNPESGEKRNTLDIEMSLLADKADLSLRTIKNVLKHPLIKKYFLRYKVRRVMTPNGVRTAGIALQVRMDDPLTPEDQIRIGYENEDIWYSSEFDDESEDESDLQYDNDQDIEDAG